VQRTGGRFRLRVGNDDAARDKLVCTASQQAATVKQNADNARQANQLASGARGQAERGGGSAPGGGAPGAGAHGQSQRRRQRLAGVLSSNPGRGPL